MNPEGIIIGAILTEKSLLAQKNGVYSFWVQPKANKNQIRLAIKDIFGVTPLGVRIFNLKGKKKMIWKKRRIVNLPKKKKAMVKIKPGEKIDLLEVSKK